MKILVKISVGVVCKEDRAFCPLPTRRGPVLGGYTAPVFRAAERFRGNAPFLRVGGQSSGAIRPRFPCNRTLPGKCPLPTRWGPVLGGYTAAEFFEQKLAAKNYTQGVLIYKLGFDTGEAWFLSPDEY